MGVGARRRRRGADPPGRRRSMTDLAVLGQDPGFRGGALAMTESFWRAAEALGRRPELHYVRVRSLDAQRDSGSVVRGRGVPQLLRGFDAVNVAGAAAAIAPRLREARTRFLCGEVGSSGLAAFLARLRYGFLIATSLMRECQLVRRCGEYVRGGSFCVYRV